MLKYYDIMVLIVLLCKDPHCVYCIIISVLFPSINEDISSFKVFLSQFWKSQLGKNPSFERGPVLKMPPKGLDFIISRDHLKRQSDFFSVLKTNYLFWKTQLGTFPSIEKLKKRYYYYTTQCQIRVLEHA